MDVLLAVYLGTQRLLAFPYISLKKKSNSWRQQLVHNLMHNSTSALSSSLSTIPTATAVPLENGLIYISGIIGKDRWGYFDESFIAQCDAVLHNLDSILKKSHSCFDFLLKINVFLRDDGDDNLQQERIRYFLQKYEDFFVTKIPFEPTFQFVSRSQLESDIMSKSETPLSSAEQPDIVPPTPSLHPTTPPTYQNLPRPSLTVLTTRGFFNSSAIIQIDAIACQKLISDPTISIDHASAPLHLDPEQEIKSYREYTQYKWDNYASPDDLERVEEYDLKYGSGGVGLSQFSYSKPSQSEEHPAIYHAKLQIRLEMEEVDRIGFDQKSMLKHITTPNGVIFPYFPSVHAVIHVPTGYTYIGGVNGILPIQRGIDMGKVFGEGGKGGRNGEIGVNGGDSDVKIPPNTQKNGSIDVNGSKKSLNFSNLVKIAPKSNTSQQYPPKIPVHLDVFEPNDGKEWEDSEGYYGVESSTVKVPALDGNPMGAILAGLMTPEPISGLKYATEGDFAGEKTEKIEKTGNTENNQNNQNNHNNEGESENKEENKLNKYEKTHFAMPTLIDISLLKLIFAEKINQDVTQYFNSTTPTPYSLEVQLLPLLGTNTFLHAPPHHSSNPPPPLNTPPLTNPPAQLTVPSHTSDPRLWLLRYTLTLTEYANVFAQTRQAIFNLISISQAAQLNIFTSTLKLTIYTTSTSYLPYIKYAFQLYWPHHPINDSCTELFALSIVPVVSLLHDALVEFEATCLQHEQNKPFLPAQSFSSPPTYYSAINTIFWHSLFYLLYPDDGSINVGNIDTRKYGQIHKSDQNLTSNYQTSFTPLYQSSVINRLAKGQFMTKMEQKRSEEMHKTEVMLLKLQEYQYMELLKQASSLEVHQHDKLYVPYYYKPLEIYRKQAEKKLKNDIFYQFAVKQREMYLKSQKIPKNKRILLQTDGDTVDITSSDGFDFFYDQDGKLNYRERFFEGESEEIDKKRYKKIQKHNSDKKLTPLIDLTNDIDVTAFHIEVGPIDDPIPRAVVQKKELPLQFVEKKWKTNTHSAFSISCTVSPSNYDQQLRFTHLTEGVYPDSIGNSAFSGVGGISGGVSGGHNYNNLRRDFDHFGDFEGFGAKQFSGNDNIHRIHYLTNDNNNYVKKNNSSLLSKLFSPFSWLLLAISGTSYEDDDGDDSNMHKYDMIDIDDDNDDDDAVKFLKSQNNQNDEKNKNNDKNDDKTPPQIPKRQLPIHPPVPLETVSAAPYYPSLLATATAHIMNMTHVMAEAMTINTLDGTRQETKMSKTVDEKWYNYQYFGEYYQPQDIFHTKNDLIILLLKQYERQQIAITKALYGMIEDEVTVKPTPILPTRDDIIGVISEDNDITKSQKQPHNASKTASKTASKNTPDDSNQSPQNPPKNRYNEDSDDDDDNDGHNSNRIPPPPVPTHTELYSRQYGFPCAPLKAVMIEDKIRYCLKFGHHISDRFLNGLFYPRVGFTPGSIYTSAFVGNNFVHLYGSIFKLLKLLKQNITPVKINFIVAVGGDNKITKNVNNKYKLGDIGGRKDEGKKKLIGTNLFGDYFYDKVNKMTGFDGNSGLKSNYGIGETSIGRHIGMTNKSNQNNQHNGQNGTEQKSSSRRPHATTLLLTAPSKPSLYLARNNDCLKFLRFFQLFLGVFIPYRTNPLFYDKARMFGDYRRNQRPVITTYQVDELPNGAKYHIEVIAVFR